MPEVTHILTQIESGDPGAAEQLLPLVYEELRKLAAVRMAGERSDHTLQATALVHEAYLRLVLSEAPDTWRSRGHFFAAAAEAMRRILVDHARQVNSLKRGGGHREQSFSEPSVPDDDLRIDVLDLDAALSCLEQAEPDKARLVKLRYFAGLTLEEAAAALEISIATASRHWTYARAWLYGRLHDDQLE